MKIEEDLAMLFEEYTYYDPERDTILLPEYYDYIFNQLDRNQLPHILYEIELDSSHIPLDLSTSRNRKRILKYVNKDISVKEMKSQNIALNVLTVLRELSILINLETSIDDDDDHFRLLLLRKAIQANLIDEMYDGELREVESSQGMYIDEYHRERGIELNPGGKITREEMAKVLYYTTLLIEEERKKQFGYLD
jgi:hypothetical protein